MPRKNRMTAEEVLETLLDRFFFVAGGGHLHFKYDEGTYINDIIGDAFEKELSKYLTGENKQDYIKQNRTVG